MEMLNKSPLRQATRDACVVLVDDRVSVTDDDVMKVNMGGQKVLQMHHVY